MACTAKAEPGLGSPWEGGPKRQGGRGGAPAHSEEESGEAEGAKAKAVTTLPVVETRNSFAPLAVADEDTLIADAEVKEAAREPGACRRPEAVASPVSGTACAKWRSGSSRNAATTSPVQCGPTRTERQPYGGGGEKGVPKTESCSTVPNERTASGAECQGVGISRSGGDGFDSEVDEDQSRVSSDEAVKKDKPSADGQTGKLVVLMHSVRERIALFEATAIRNATRPDKCNG